MKFYFRLLSIIIFIILSNSTFADWWNGWNNSSSSSYGNGNIQAQTTGNFLGSGRTTAKGKGDADANVDFSLTFKGKGNTEMNTASKLGGDTQGYVNSASNWNIFGSTTGNLKQNSATINKTQSFNANTPWGAANLNSIQNPNFTYAPNIFPPNLNNRFTTPLQAPNFQQMQAQMEIQRKQFEAYTQQVSAQQKTAAQAYKQQMQIHK